MSEENMGRGNRGRRGRDWQEKEELEGRKEGREEEEKEKGKTFPSLSLSGIGNGRGMAPHTVVSIKSRRS